MSETFSVSDNDDAKSNVSAKKEKSKKKISVYFGILYKKFWKLLQLNLLYVLFCIPIITIGPATAAMMKIAKNYSIEKPSFLLSDFWEAFKENFKISFIMGIINILEVFFVYNSLRIYLRFGSETGNAIWYILFTCAISIAVALFIMNFYIYLMIISANIPFKSIIKNAAVFTFLELKRNFLLTLLIFAINIALIVFILYHTFFVILFLFIPASFLAFTVAFVCYPVIQKYVINPYYEAQGEVNPEIKRTDASDDAIFKDFSEKDDDEN